MTRKRVELGDMKDNRFHCDMIDIGLDLFELQGHVVFGHKPSDERVDWFDF